MHDFSKMGKEQLRSVCRDAHISYGKMNNEQMRAALDAHYNIDVAKLDENGRDGKCPYCGINHLQNGFATYEDICDTNPKYAGEMEMEFVCLACNHEWGPKIVRKARSAPKGGTGIQIEKVREERNGIKRPSAGGKCRAIWDALDAYRDEEKEDPTVAIVKDIAVDEGWNVNNAVIEFYQWRKFNGIKGRSK